MLTENSDHGCPVNNSQWLATLRSLPLSVLWLPWHPYVLSSDTLYFSHTKGLPFPKGILFPSSFHQHSFDNSIYPYLQTSRFISGMIAWKPFPTSPEDSFFSSLLHSTLQTAIMPFTLFIYCLLVPHAHHRGAPTAGAGTLLWMPTARQRRDSWINDSFLAPWASYNSFAFCLGSIWSTEMQTGPI